MAKRKREVRPDLEVKPGFTFSFVLDGNIPSKKNRVRFGKNGTYHDKKFTDWHKQAYLQLASQWKETGWIAKTQFVTISFTFESRRIKDLTNAAESVMDLLVDCGILKDDNFIVVSHLDLNGRYIKGVSKTNVEILV